MPKLTLTQRVREAEALISALLMQDGKVIRLSEYGRKRLELWMDKKTIHTKPATGRPKG